MPPIDDELRAALGHRADLLAPAADPMAGIESRARGIRRRRGLAAVVSSAAAVAVLAVGVTALSGTTPGAAPGPLAASATPTAAAVLASRPANALTWPSTPLGSEDLDAAVRAIWAQQTGDDPAAVGGDQLWIGATPDGGSLALGIYQLWSPSQPEATVVVASSKPGSGTAALGSHQTTAFPELAGVVDVADSWVVVLAAPGITEVAYAPNGADFSLVDSDERAAVFARPEQGTRIDAVRFRGPGVNTTVEVGTRSGSSKPQAGVPDNVLLDWPERGTRSAGPDLEEAQQAIATGYGVPYAGSSFRVLFSGSSDGGLRYVYGQFWAAGATQAFSAGYVTGGESGPEAVLQPVTPGDAEVLAFIPCCSPGTSTDTLVVIPQPGTGQVQYGAAASEWRDVGVGQDYLDGVVLVDRDPRAFDDRLRLLDGNGRVTFEGPVASLLCGVKSCG